MKAPEAYLSHPPTPSCYCSSVPMDYVEDAFEARTKHGQRRVSARQGWAGEERSFFSILLVLDRSLEPLLDRRNLTLQSA